jgi:hypothetical protein
VGHYQSQRAYSYYQSGQAFNITTPWYYNFMSLVQSNPNIMRFISYTLWGWHAWCHYFCTI